MVKFNRLAAWIFFILLSFVGSSNADTAISMQQMFAGRNVYAPTLLQDGEYKMWYGGWQEQSDVPYDKIFYRTSSDNTVWSAPITILAPWNVSPNAVHVNDPTVTKHFNTTGGFWQYTMFYTVCMYPCNQSDNQIWSSVSNDGLTWYGHQMLLAGPSGPAEPSAIIDPQPDGTFWKVYYVDRNNATTVAMARVNGNRNAIATVPVFTGSNTVSGVDVRHFNGSWHLFMNVFHPTQVDIAKVLSGSNESWPNQPQTIISNGGPQYCGTLTPAILYAAGNQYDLYFGLTPRQANGTCDVSYQQSVQRWRMAE